MRHVINDVSSVIDLFFEPAGDCDEPSQDTNLCTISTLHPRETTDGIQLSGVTADNPSFLVLSPRGTKTGSRQTPPSASTQPPGGTLVGRLCHSSPLSPPC